MSYAQAMKHSRNIRKIRRMRRGMATHPQHYEITEEQRKENLAHLRKMQGK